MLKAAVLQELIGVSANILLFIFFKKNRWEEPINKNAYGQKERKKA